MMAASVRLGERRRGIAGSGQQPDRKPGIRKGMHRRSPGGGDNGNGWDDAVVAVVATLSAPATTARIPFAPSSGKLAG